MLGRSTQTIVTPPG